MNTERWKQFDDTEYLISTLGNVWSNKSNKLLSKIDDGRGYLAVGIDGIKIKVHRLVAFTFIPNDDDNANTVNHKNGIKTDNRVENLEWLSHEDNLEHAFENNLFSHGETFYNAILSDDDVENIKLLFVEYKLNNTEIGKLYGVSKGTISKIRTGNTWRIIRPDLRFESSSPNKGNAKKLCGEDIPIIRELYNDGLSLAYIGKEFGVHSGTISGIVSGRTWKNY